MNQEEGLSSGHSSSVQFNSLNFFLSVFVHDLNVTVLFCKMALFVCLFIHNGTMLLVASAVTVWEKSFICSVWCFLKFILQEKSKKNREAPFLTQCSVCVYMKSERTLVQPFSLFHSLNASSTGWYVNFITIEMNQLKHLHLILIIKLQWRIVND